MTTRTRLSAALLALAVLTTSSSTAFARPATDVLTSQRDRALSYMHTHFAAKKFEHVLDWPALTLYAAGTSATAPSWSTAAGENGVTWREQSVRNNRGLSDATTDFESVLLGLLASGQNPRGFGKKDFVQAIRDAQRPDGKFADTLYGHGDEYVNAHIYAIIALYAAGEPIPNAGKAAEWLIAQQHADGGFHWNAQGTSSDPDMTAAALIALKALGLGADNGPVQKAFAYLLANQNTAGGFSSMGATNADTAAMVIEALLMWGIDPATWAKNGHDPVDFLASYQTADGSFLHVQGQSSTLMSTNSATLALSDVLHGSSVYQRLHDQHRGPKLYTPAFPDLPFTHRYYAANIKLANLGVMAGHPDGRYGPDDLVTREQFAKILVFGLRMQEEATARTTQFADVPTDRWSNPYIHLALTNQYVYGTSPTTFDPNGAITGAQLMAILVRMLGLEAEAQARQTDTWYSGYVAVAKEHGLWYPDFDPSQPATRSEVGVAFVHFYEVMQVSAQ